MDSTCIRYGGRTIPCSVADQVAYLAARALQFFVPGVPQVYYVGLLAGTNDEPTSANADGREINRHNYSLSRDRSSGGASSRKELAPIDCLPKFPSGI